MNRIRWGLGKIASFVAWALLACSFASWIVALPSLLSAISEQQTGLGVKVGTTLQLLFLALGSLGLAGAVGVCLWSFHGGRHAVPARAMPFFTLAIVLFVLVGLVDTVVETRFALGGCQTASIPVP